LLFAAAVLFGNATAFARVFASPEPTPIGEFVSWARDALPLLGSATDLPPQAVAQAGPNGPRVDPSHLDVPERLEVQLRSALATPISETQLTVVGGVARIGNYSLGSAE